MKRLLAAVIVVLLGAGVAGAATERGASTASGGSRTDDSDAGRATDGRNSGTRGPSTTAPSVTVIVLRPGQARLGGTVSTGSFDGASAAPLALPLTITATTRGATRAVVTNAVVDGQRVTVTWDGGQPLPLSGTGKLEVAGAHLDIATDGLTWALDGDPRRLLPGRYDAHATVAVGRSGLATPVDGTTFTADDQTVLTTVKGAIVRVGASPLHLEGPGSFDVHGAVRVETADGSRVEDRVRFGPGSFVLDLTPTAGGWQVQGLLEGPLQEG